MHLALSIYNFMDVPQFLNSWTDPFSTKTQAETEVTNGILIEPKSLLLKRDTFQKCQNEQVS
jgi:hypothetical protein